MGGHPDRYAKKAEPDNQISITRMCQLLGVSRSGYHAGMTAKAITAHANSEGTYGASRVLAELRATGETGPPSSPRVHHPS